MALARRFARDITSGHPGDHHDDILVVSELVTNAIRAARTLRAWRPKDLPVRLGICATDRLTRIIVEDPDPVMREPRSGDECGRGLIIVAALAEHLWIDEVIGGKVVIADVTA